MLLLFALFLAISAKEASGQSFELDQSHPATQFVTTDKSFEDALSRRISVQWQKVPLRLAIRRISETARIAILVDRRLDPDHEVNLEVTDEHVQKILERVAHDQSASLRKVSHVVYIGPEQPASVVRTIAAARRAELTKSEIHAHRHQALVHHATLAWGGLSQPSQLLEDAAKFFALKVEGRDQIPYDLWNRGALPQLSAPEMLTLLLIQFDRTFEWTHEGNGIQIVPLPSSVVITQTHKPPHGKTAATAAEEWKSLLPNATFHVRPGEVSVTATLEEHESISGPRKPAGTHPADSAPAKTDDLSRQRFTMQGVKEVALSRLLDKLSHPASAGLTFKHDEDELKHAGIRLDHRIDLNVKSVTIQVLLKTALDQAGLDFEMHGRNVRLFPKKK